MRKLPMPLCVLTVPNSAAARAWRYHFSTFPFLYPQWLHLLHWSFFLTQILIRSYRNGLLRQSSSVPTVAHVFLWINWWTAGSLKKWLQLSILCRRIRKMEKVAIVSIAANMKMKKCFTTAIHAKLPLAATVQCFVMSTKVTNSKS